MVPTARGCARGAPDWVRKHGFGVFASEDNLAYDAQVASALTFNDRVASSVAPASVSSSSIGNIAPSDGLAEDHHIYFFAVAGSNNGLPPVSGRRWWKCWVQLLCSPTEAAKAVFYGLLRLGESRFRSSKAFPEDARAVRNFVDSLDVGHGGAEKEDIGDAHDGVCPLASVIYPRLSSGQPFRASRLRSATERGEAAAPALERGVWYWETIPVDHLGVVGMPECPETQKNFFEAMFRRQAQLPVAAESKKKRTLAPPRLPWSPKCSAVSAVDEDSGTQSDGSSDSGSDDTMEDDSPFSSTPPAKVLMF